MTALQDWLSLRPADQSTFMDIVCRPLRLVRNIPDVEEISAFTLMTPGVERC